MRQPYDPSHFWYSKLNDARFCLRYFQLKHIDRIPMHDTSLDLEFGTAVNNGLNAILRGENDGLFDFDLYWHGVSPELPQSRFNWETLEAMGHVLLRKFRDGHAKHFEPYDVGKRLYGSIGPHPFEGEPDFWGLYKGEPTVLDFKTSAGNYPEEKLACSEQLSTYAHLIEQAYGQKPTRKGYFVLVKDYKEPKIQRPLVSELTEPAESNILSNIVETCDDLKARKSFPMNTSNCVRGKIVCPFFEKCWGKRSEA